MSVRRKKLLTSLLAIAFCLVAVSAQTVEANPDPIVVEIVPSTDSILPLEQFYVNVTISNILESHNLVGIEFQIIWNTSLMYATKIELPPGHIFQAAEDDGNIWIIRKSINHTLAPDTAWYLVTCSDIAQGYTNGYLPLTGSGVAAKITFNSTDGEGISPVSFKLLPPSDVKVKLSDRYGVQITDYVVIESQIDIVPEFSGSFLYVILLASSLIVIIISKKFPKRALTLQ